MDVFMRRAMTKLKCDPVELFQSQYRDVDGKRRRMSFIDEDLYYSLFDNDNIIVIRDTVEDKERVSKILQRYHLSMLPKLNEDGDMDRILYTHSNKDKVHAYTDEYYKIMESDVMKGYGNLVRQTDLKCISNLRPSYISRNIRKDSQTVILDGLDEHPRPQVLDMLIDMICTDTNGMNLVFVVNSSMEEYVREVEGMCSNVSMVSYLSKTI